MASTDIRELLRLVPECFGGVVKIEISRGNETFISAFVQEDKVIFSGASHADESFVKTDVHLVLKDALDSRTIGNMRIMSFVPLSLDIHSPGDRADTKKVLGMLSSLIARTIDAKLDGLTALPVRKYFQRTLEEHVARFLSDGRGFSLISADIDRFKDINDEFGHDAGDRVLSAIGRILHNSVRGRSDCTDSVFRNGGEEFGIILSDASIYEAISIGERFRLSIKSHDFGIGRTVTCSFGVAEISEVSGAGDLGKALYKLADERLYQAKDIGRDSVVASESGTSQVRMKAVTLDKAVNE
jgi:diguanylate cyclase (GGDEF)-like protein